MPSATTITLLDRLEIILEALAEMPPADHTETELCRALVRRGQRPMTHHERQALAALGRELSPTPG
ncbi:MAG: hypothetical protein LBU05_04035 [Bifidobacteriaceae bacterium]|jgi:hypothetical protein|nr:hypothetical protein [Bifidobacteriaceae bacterium]